MTAKTIVITGVSRGLGRAMVDGFIERGHTVAGCGRSIDAIDTLSARYSEPHMFEAIDVVDNDRVQTWADNVIARVGSPDLLLNNAAIINRNAPLWDVPVDKFSTVVDINIKGVTNVIRHFVPKMIERGCGVIINFSSIWGRSTSADVAPYCATKWAIEGLTKALSQELPEGMAAIPCSPGVINTDMLQSCFGSAANSYPTAIEWAETAVPFFLQLGPQHSGESMSAPG